ncbi:MAG TPA: hopanoid biosynthesis-associated protein HpnK [Rhizomicrobium sp.]|nr:hopanoid biosynthesis-associated protein HpnK [Rhizomicrobium sp.]
MIKRTIFTADDFGLDQAVNEAVEHAHRDGVLTAASLMVTAPAALDAIARAKRLPALAVGLHLVLVLGEPALPKDEAAALLGRNGSFPDSPAEAGVRYFFSLSARRTLAREIRAQFEAFRRTGLPLDHVDGHTHLHIHPTIFALLLEIGREYGMKAMRVPYENPAASARAAGKERLLRTVVSSAFAPWARNMRRRLGREGVVSNDAQFGFHDTGRMTEELVLRQLEELEPGRVTEFYFHPATRKSDILRAQMPDYLNVQEFEALCSPRLREALTRLDIKPVAFRDLS